MNTSDQKAQNYLKKQNIVFLNNMVPTSGTITYSNELLHDRSRKNCEILRRINLFPLFRLYYNAVLC